MHRDRQPQFAPEAGTIILTTRNTDTDRAQKCRPELTDTDILTEPIKNRMTSSICHSQIECSYKLQQTRFDVVSYCPCFPSFFLRQAFSISPAKRQSKWSAEEDALIIDLRGGGMEWEDVSKKLPGRSAISCRLHYQNYLERRSEWDEERKNKLAKLYERYTPKAFAKSIRTAHSLATIICPSTILEPLHGKKTDLFHRFKPEGPKLQKRWQFPGPQQKQCTGNSVK